MLTINTYSDMNKYKKKIDVRKIDRLFKHQQFLTLRNGELLFLLIYMPQRVIK